MFKRNSTITLIALAINHHAQATDNVVCVATTSALRNALFFAASNGKADVIQLVQGTYTGSFVYPGPAEAFDLTIRGGYTANCASRVVDAANTILDGNNSATALAIAITGATANVTVEGLTLRNGNNSTSNTGGGLYIGLGSNASSAVIQKCRFETNTASKGGGAYISGTATLTSNTFSGNTSSGYGYSGGGGGAYISGAATLTSNTFSGNDGYIGNGGGAYFVGTATLTSNTFSGNTVRFNSDYGEGGGAYFASSATLISNTFSGNASTAGNGGSGGGANFAGAATLTSNTFSGNASSVGGGASFSGTATLTSNTFSGNTSSVGGGAYFAGSSATLVNNIFSSNTSRNYGGGNFMGTYYDAHYGVTASLINNSFYKNTAPKGGGLFLTLPSTETLNTSILANNLFWANTASAGEGADLWLNNDADNDYTPTPLQLFVGNALDQSYPSGFASALPILTDHNLDKTDPLFVNAASNDLHLSAGSPVIDTGDKTVPGLPSTDRDAAQRVVGANVDIGAYEYPSNASTAPAVSTDAPSVVTANSATLKGTVNPEGAATNVSFDFGLTTAYGTSIAATPATIAATAAATNVSANKTGLACGSTYHYRVKAVNSVGNTNGADKAFTTSGCGLCGDSDGNNVVNIVDALAVARYVVNLPPPPPINVVTADVDQDGLVTIVDALLIAKRSVGLVITGTCF